VIGRQQLPVSSPIALRGLIRGAASAIFGGEEALAGLKRDLRARFGAGAVVLTDSGTSALVLALRLSARHGGTVAYPGFGCADLAAAAEYAGVRIRLYDVDPSTLSPDLESLEGALRRGVDAVVVTHLYGYPADVPGVVSLATRHGASVIEDAAQGAAGTLGGRLLGAFGPLVVLSFGRGKGLTGGAGGALLAIDEAATRRLEELHASDERRGARELLLAGAQWALGRPAAYAIPSAIPWLRLGEMVYHRAHEPRSLAFAAAGMVRVALQEADAAAARRRTRAARLLEPWPEGAIRTIAGGQSGMLRLALRATVDPPTRLGVVKGYPQTLFEQPQLRPLLCQGETEQTGARTLRSVLRTAPVHDWVSARDLSEIGRWIRTTTSGE
jgi:dTDP-4-amino-4,6-dideoxygalactose transaminase